MFYSFSALAEDAPKKKLQINIPKFSPQETGAELFHDAVQEKKRLEEMFGRWREAMNRMPEGTRISVPKDPKKKTDPFKVTKPYVDSEIISINEQRHMEVVQNELNALCLQCSNWKKFFGKNERLPTAEQCEQLRKKNAKEEGALFPPHPETKRVGRPCEGGYLVKTTSGALDNCYCMDEKLAEDSFANDVVPVAETCQVEFYDKHLGHRMPDKRFTFEEMKKALPEVNKVFTEQAKKTGRRTKKNFVPNLKNKAAEGVEYFMKPHGKLKYAAFTNVDLYASDGKTLLDQDLGARVFCPEAPAHLMEPKETRAFATSKYSGKSCPCTSSAKQIPESLNLPGMKEGFIKLGKFGEGITYKLVDESLLPENLRKKTTKPVRRTGYGISDNSPPGDNAGFAAIKRKNKGATGKANLGVNGKGTLNNPVTAAISPAFARKYGVCQGDMLFDPKYGWLRVEGGCTSNSYNGKLLGERVDVWRGGLSKQEEGLNVDASFVHFPAGLIDKDFAEKNPSAPVQVE